MCFIAVPPMFVNSLHLGLIESLDAVVVHICDNCFCFAKFDCVVLWPIIIAITIAASTTPPPISNKYSKAPCDLLFLLFILINFVTCFL